MRVIKNVGLNGHHRFLGIEQLLTIPLFVQTLEAQDMWEHTP